MTRTPGRVLVIGLGGVSRCALPLLFDRLPIPAHSYTVLDFADTPAEFLEPVKRAGAQLVQERITPENYAEILGRYVGPGDLIVDLAWNIDTLEVLAWCRTNDVRYLNASIEVWDPYADADTTPAQERTLYARHMKLRELLASWGDNAGPTAILDHGANPGLVSHFTKAALLDIAERCLADATLLEPGARRDAVTGAVADRDWARLAQSLGVATIHISERDTQISAEPKRVNEFVNTWSVEGFYEEGIAPAEMGWGTHERTLPPGARTHDAGPRNQICIAHPGCRTWVRSWVPCGEIVGMVIRHGEAFSISDRLTVWADDAAVYRPTVHYAYCPADAAIASLHELAMRGDRLQTDQRIMGDDIIEGRDELGVLLMGHPLRSWWYGSLLDIHETRTLAPQQNATTLQVAAAVLAGVQWMLDNPSSGVLLPDDLPHEEILEIARPYLGPVVSESVDWSPLDDWQEPFPGARPRPAEADSWQFGTFLVRGPQG
jgi:homospermidine synthase